MYSILLQKPPIHHNKNFTTFFWGRDLHDFSHFLSSPPSNIFKFSLYAKHRKNRVHRVPHWLSTTNDVPNRVLFQKIAYQTPKSRTKNPKNPKNSLEQFCIIYFCLTKLINFSILGRLFSLLGTRYFHQGTRFFHRFWKSLHRIILLFEPCHRQKIVV